MSDLDTMTLKSMFQFAWDCFTTEFEVLGFTVSWWQIAVSCFAILLVFRFVRGIVSL